VERLESAQDGLQYIQRSSTSGLLGGSQGPGKKFVSLEHAYAGSSTAYLEFNLSLSNILLTATTRSNLLCLGDLVPHSLL
jgi:hypothetical protein